MANLPAKRPEVPDTAVQGLIDQLSLGKTPREIGKALHPDDRKAQRATRRRLERLILTDDRVAAGVFARARVLMLSGLVPATAGLIERAQRGRPDAVKLLYEASTFHNPKVQHEHSGEIKIAFDIPRPQPVNDDRPDHHIVDADVVEE